MAAHGYSNALVPGRFNVWVPGRAQNAYRSFDTAAEAQKAVRAQASGVIIDPQGQVDPAMQAWAGWTRYQHPDPGVPPVVLSAPPNPNAAAATTRPGAPPVFPTAPASAPPSALQPQRTPGKFAVWFPQSQLGHFGIPLPETMLGGAYLPYETLEEAEADVTVRGLGAVLDPDGALHATQGWASAQGYASQLRNNELSPKPTAGRYNVWFPQAVFSRIGVDAGSRLNDGGFLAFDSKQLALDHARQRGNLGVLVDDQGRLDAAQVWVEAQSWAIDAPGILPAASSGWVSAPSATEPAVAARLGQPTAGSIAVADVRATPKGADVTTDVASMVPGDTIHFFVGAQINGNWVPIFSIPEAVTLASPGWTRHVLHLDYGAIETYLKSVNPALGLTPDMSAAIGVRFTSGHDTGIPGWGGKSSTAKDALITLPAKTASSPGRVSSPASPRVSQAAAPAAPSKPWETGPLKPLFDRSKSPFQSDIGRARDESAAAGAGFTVSKIALAGANVQATPESYAIGTQKPMTLALSTRLPNDRFDAVLFLNVSGHDWPFVPLEEKQKLLQERADGNAYNIKVTRPDGTTESMTGILARGALSTGQDISIQNMTPGKYVLEAWPDHTHVEGDVEGRRIELTYAPAGDRLE